MYTVKLFYSLRSIKDVQYGSFTLKSKKQKTVMDFVYTCCKGQYPEAKCSQLERKASQHSRIRLDSRPNGNQSISTGKQMGFNISFV